MTPIHRFRQVYSHHHRIGVLVELAMDSEFSARTDEFQRFALDLARIFHQPSTAAVDLAAVARRTPSSPLDVVLATPARSSSPCAAPRRHLGALVYEHW